MPLMGRANRADEEPAISAGWSGRLMRFGITLINRLILTILLQTGLSRAADVSPSEYQLKAAFLYHFSQFVDWPPATFATSKSATDASFVIGILGDNPFGGDLEQTVHGKNLGRHALMVREFHSLAEATNNCQILFISSSEKKRLPELIANLGGANILTVGEAENFGEAGGMIHFVMEGTKIRFRVNEAATQRAGLKVSAKLLSLASHTAH